MFVEIKENEVINTNQIIRTTYDSLVKKVRIYYVNTRGTSDCQFVTAQEFYFIRLAMKDVVKGY